MLGRGLQDFIEASAKGVDNSYFRHSRVAEGGVAIFIYQLLAWLRLLRYGCNDVN
jgi:hypothetical protein